MVSELNAICDIVFSSISFSCRMRTLARSVFFFFLLNMYIFFMTQNKITAFTSAIIVVFNVIKNARVAPTLDLDT